MPATKYHGEETIKLTQKLVNLGATNLQIADILEISESCFYNWCEQHPEFKEALALQKEICDAQVERSLYQRAIGYTAPDGRHVQPNVTAQIVWLKNRQPDQWRDVQEYQHKHEPVPDGGEQDVVNIARRLLFMVAEAGQKLETTH